MELKIYSYFLRYHESGLETFKIILNITFIIIMESVLISKLTQRWMYFPQFMLHYFLPKGYNQSIIVFYIRVDDL